MTGFLLFVGAMVVLLFVLRLVDVIVSPLDEAYRRAVRRGLDKAGGQRRFASSARPTRPPIPSPPGASAGDRMCVTASCDAQRLPTSLRTCDVCLQLTQPYSPSAEGQGISQPARSAPVADVKSPRAAAGDSGPGVFDAAFNLGNAALATVHEHGDRGGHFQWFDAHPDDVDVVPEIGEMRLRSERAREFIGVRFADGFHGMAGFTSLEADDDGPMIWVEVFDTRDGCSVAIKLPLRRTSSGGYRLDGSAGSVEGIPTIPGVFDGHRSELGQTAVQPHDDRVCVTGSCDAFGLPTPLSRCDVCGSNTQHRARAGSPGGTVDGLTPAITP